MTDALKGIAAVTIAEPSVVRQSEKKWLEPSPRFVTERQRIMSMITPEPRLRGLLS